MIITAEKETNRISVHAIVQDAEAVINEERFRDEARFGRIAASWPMARLVEIWNSLPGVRPVRKFRDRTTAVSRIWKAVHSLKKAPVEKEVEPVAGESATAAGLTATKSVCKDPAHESALSKAPTLEVDLPSLDKPVTTQTPRLAAATDRAEAKLRGAISKPSANSEEAGALKESSKTCRVIQMLRRDGGTTLEEIMTTMNWQKHTARAMLSAGGSLAKNHGLIVAREKIGEQRIYLIRS